jgi:phytoene dehydrogenase-like protein
MPEYDAIVVGAGPNGLAAAIELARAGWSVLLCEARETVGGGARTEQLTLPGFLHDVCSAIHPLGIGSPFFRSIPLHEYGLEWIQPEIALAHPFDDGIAALSYHSLDKTASGLGEDGAAYRRLMQPFARQWDKLAEDILGPLHIPPHHPFLMARFGLGALLPTTTLVDTLFKNHRTRAMFAGLAAHSFLPLEQVATASFGMVLGILGHAFGWPIPRGGSQSIVNAMAAYLGSLGGKIQTGFRVEKLEQLPSARAYVFDVTPRQLLRIAGEHLPPGYRRKLETYRYGPGIFKVDWALREPIPWKIEECKRAGTVHIGATLDEIALSERQSNQGKISEKPFVLFAQQSLFDSTRAPDGQHTGWAYCHVPHGSTIDMTQRIEAQVERMAPGFRDIILARNTLNSAQYEQYNPNVVGGDINGGIQDLRQLFNRPTWRTYSTPNPSIFLCSSSTPPGGGVHGMCGYHAARTVLQKHR